MMLIFQLNFIKYFQFIQKLMAYTNQICLPQSPKIALLIENIINSTVVFSPYSNVIIKPEWNYESLNLVEEYQVNKIELFLEIPELLLLPAPALILTLPAPEPILLLPAPESILQLSFPDQIEQWQTILHRINMLISITAINLFYLKLNQIVYTIQYQIAQSTSFNHLYPYGTIFQENQLLIPNYNAGRSEYQLIVNSRQSHTFRTCFVLEPGAIRDHWYIYVILQAINDPSLFLGSDLIVHKQHSSSISKKFLLKHFGHFSFVLRIVDDINRAAKLFTPLDQLYLTHTHELTDLQLTTNETYQYLTQASIPLQAMGFGIKVPSWWRSPETKIELKVDLESDKEFYISSGFFSVDNLMHYDWQIMLGKHKLSQAEFNQIVQLKVPLIPIRGQWAELNPAEIVDIVHFIKIYPKYPRNKAKQVISGKDSLLFGNRSKCIRFASDGKIGDILNLFTQPPPLELISPPLSLDAHLRPYQIQGVSWLNYMLNMGMGACLADDMGLGKTIQILTYLLFQKDHGYKTVIAAKNSKSDNTIAENRKKPIKKFKISSKTNSSKIPTSAALIICPLSLIGTWKKEIERFTPSLSCFIHYGETLLPTTTLSQALATTDIVLTTYQKAIKDKSLLQRVHWGHVILDEAQNIKNPKTKQAQSIKSFKASQKLALTGTPIENHLSELWSIMDFLNPGYLGCLEDFQKLFAIPIELYQDNNQAQYLKQLVNPFILRRLKTDKNIIPDLPQKQNNKIYIHLTPEQASLYEAVGQNMLEEIREAEGIKRKGIILATLTKLKQICNHPMHFMHELNPNTLFKYNKTPEEIESMLERSGKMNQLIEMLPKILKDKEKVLIFTQYREMGAYLQFFLSKILQQKILFLSGSNSFDDRISMINEFQSPSGPQIFVLSLKAGGTGLTLTAANHVFHFDRWWNPAVEEQASDRAYRIGQTRMVSAYKFICTGTLEEKIDLLIDQKRDLADKVLSSSGSWITDLSLDQLRDLFCLRKNAFHINSNAVDLQIANC